MNNSFIIRDSWYKDLLLAYSIVMGTILTLGLIGNGLNLVIFYRHKSIRPFTRILLIQLTIYDFLSLVFSGIHAEFLFNNNGFDFRLGRRLLCQIHSFFSFTFSYGSMHTLCLVAIDRYLLVKFPTSPRIKSLSRKHGFILCGFVLIINMIINTPFLDPADFLGIVCATLLLLELWYNMSLLIAYVIIPTVGCMVPCILMIYELNKHNRNMNTQNKKPNSFSSHIWAVKMIIVASTYMCITFASINILNILSNLGMLGNYLFLVQTVGYGFWMFTNSNCAIKFYLYNLATSHFRRNFLKLVFNIDRKVAGSATSSSNMEESAM